MRLKLPRELRDSIYQFCFENYDSNDLIDQVRNSFIDGALVDPKLVGYQIAREAAIMAHFMATPHIEIMRQRSTRAKVLLAKRSEELDNLNQYLHSDLFKLNITPSDHIRSLQIHIYGSAEQSVDMARGSLTFENGRTIGLKVSAGPTFQFKEDRIVEFLKEFRDIYYSVLPCKCSIKLLIRSNEGKIQQAAVSLKELYSTRNTKLKTSSGENYWTWVEEVLRGAEGIPAL